MKVSQLVRSKALNTSVTLGMIFSLAPQAVFAQTSLNTAVQPMNSEAIQIGVAAAVSGDVRIDTQDSVGQVLESGRPIHIGDTVKTDAKGRLQILLLDETVFTIGPESAIVIDEFIYDPATADGKISAQVIQGAFRFVTGKIGHKEPKNMQVNLPTGTIGVRGTMVTGRVAGRSSMVALLGPGPNNRVGARVGRIQVSNNVGQQVHSVMVTQPGFGTTISGDNEPPTPPAIIPTEILHQLENDLAPLEKPKDNGPKGPADRGPRGQDSDKNNQPGTAPRGPDGEFMDGEGPDGGFKEGPPTREAVMKMEEDGEISPDQADEMLSDMDAYENGDPETRAALDEKYGGGEGREGGQRGPNAKNGPAGYASNGGGYEGGYRSEGATAGMALAPRSGGPNDPMGGPGDGMGAPPGGFDPGKLAGELKGMLEAGEIDQEDFNMLMGSLDTLTEQGPEAFGPDGFGPDGFDGDFDPDFFDPGDVYDATTDSAQTAADSANQIMTGLAKKDDLINSIETGVFYFTRTDYNAFVQDEMDGSDLYQYYGDMEIDLQIDFGSRKFGGGGSYLRMESTSGGGDIDKTIAIPNTGFASGNGFEAIYDFTGPKVEATLEFENEGGVAGNVLNVEATYEYDDGDGTDAGYGSMDHIHRY